MHFFASWWERFPRRKAASLIVAVALLGMSTHAAGVLRLFIQPTAFGWS
jgi:hypothetical protein